MFDFQLLENYGHAGPMYIEWVLKNLEQVKATLKVVQIKIDRELKLTQRERFWSAMVAANITGGMISRRLKLIDWDLSRIYEYACNLIQETRNDVQAPLETHMVVVGEYLNRHIHNILVVNDAADARSNLQEFPKVEPKGELLVRYELDTKRMYIDYKHFREDCIKRHINFKELTKELKKRGSYMKSDNKRMSKGMKVNTTSVYALEFDTSSGDFIDVESMVEPESGGAG
jgi:hypothetical protein